MATMIHSVPRGPERPIAIVADFIHWLPVHRGAIGMAALLAFAAPVTFFASAVSVMREPTTEDVLALIAWFALFGVELGGLLLLVGYLLQRLKATAGHVHAATLLGAAAAAAIAELSNGRGHILVDQGVVQSTQAMHAYAFVSALIMALLFFAHLNRSRAQEEAAARLAAAQAEQHEARRRLGQARLQAVQARIDPQLLFDMLEAVRRAYEDDASRAERLLDELASFLRAALPRLRSTSSTVLREARLAHAYAQLRTLTGATDIRMRLDVSDDVVDARFPPGVLLPLLDDALRARAGACELTATRCAGECRLVLTLPSRPLNAAVDRVRSLLADLYGPAAELRVADGDGVANATVKVPYEPAGK